MPNPKTQTVTMDLKGALAELRKGRTEFRSDKTGVVHMTVGKVSMDPEKVAENASVALKEIAVATTMGPGVMVDSRELI